MIYKNKASNVLLMSIFVLLLLINQPMQVHASGTLVVGDRERHHGHGEYVAVMVSGNRYYYNQGIFYTGSPGSYIAIEAPVGAIVYDEPASFEVVYIEGVRYYRNNNIYYRPHFGGRYEVVRIKEHHDEGDHRGGGPGRHHGHD